MKDIQMVDLRQQYERLKSDIDAAIHDVIRSAAFIRGPEVELFEKELAAYMGVRHVVSCANGTDALQVAMMALGLKPGDEVITTNFTFIATVEVIALLGLTPVLADPCPSSFNITPDAIEKAITPRTKAIVPVHLFGQCCDMEGIMDVARRHGLKVIEDTAQSTGTTFRYRDGREAKAGTIGDTGCTSFFPSKNLGCWGDGGAIYTNDDALAAKMRSITNHGMRVRYYHDDVGINSRLDTIQAAILRVKLRHLDEFNSARRRAAEFYNAAFRSLPAVITPGTVSWSDHIYHQYTLRITDGRRDELKAALLGAGIPSMIYYPVPLSRQKAYEGYGFSSDSYPVTDMLAREVLSLPMHSELKEEHLRHIAGTLINFFK
ncbi:MAG: DegT/DnrJ/EryC1/StrS family aminotransferase [Bacteroidales bacterium]|jgi:dTDP-4-amino-4,6-dideoxygalactose transaminase|nr:DegT/DnrJ/EryC1/StrS family aminotransferase [Bacteroidales bacterium]